MGNREKRHFNNKPVGYENVPTKKILYKCDGKKGNRKKTRNSVEVILAVISMVLAVMSITVNLIMLSIE